MFCSSIKPLDFLKYMDIHVINTTPRYSPAGSGQWFTRITGYYKTPLPPLNGTCTAPNDTCMCVPTLHTCDAAGEKSLPTIATIGQNMGGDILGGV